MHTVLWSSHGHERAYLNLVGHTAMDLHELFDSETLKGRDYGFELCLHEYGIKPVLVAYRFEDVELDERQAVSLAILKLLKELALRLVVEVGILGVLDIAQPDGRVDNLRLCLNGSTHTLMDGKLYVLIRTACQFLLRLLHLDF